MLKYISTLVIALSFIACQSDSSMDQAQQQQQQQPQDPMAEQTQPEFGEGQATEVDLSDEELEQFVEAIVSAQELQMESQEEMMEIVEGEGISVEMYNQITQAQQMGQTEEEIDASAEDMENYNNALQKIMEVEERMEPQMVAAIEETGMSMERYQEINMAVQQDPALQQRIQQELQASGMMGQ